MSIIVCGNYMWIIIGFLLIAWGLVLPTAQAEQICQDRPGEGPEMVMIPAGRFVMGSPESEAGRSSDEGPQHEVSIPKPFAMMRCEVTVGAFRRFVEDSGYQTDAEQSGKGCFTWDASKENFGQFVDVNWRNPRFPGVEQNDSHPVICVSWQDANEYAAWLTQKTGHDYRLPTEAEWEYAARANTSTAYSFGDDVAELCKYANGADQSLKNHAPLADSLSGWTFSECNDQQVFTAPVGSYQNNPWGLYDMHGNVWEWTQDCWHGNYTDAPTDGTAWQAANEGDCSRRVVRGGGWFDFPRFLRSAYRSRNYPASTDIYQGFRLARTLWPFVLLPFDIFVLRTLLTIRTYVPA